MNTKLLFALMAAAAFLSFMSFIQRNSALADRKGWRGLFTWIGVICGCIAIYLLYRVITNADRGPEN